MIAKSTRMDQQKTDSSVSNINLSIPAEARFQPPNVISISESSQAGLTEKKEESSSVGSVYLEETESDKVQVSDRKWTTRANSKKKYDNIPDDIRIKLLDAVENKGEKIKHVAKSLAINYSSAKSICQVFRKEGRTKKMLIKKRMNPIESTAVEQKSGPIVAVFNQQPEANHTINKQIYKEDFEESNDATDTLTKLRNKLLRGRNNTSVEREDFPPYKKLHQSYDATFDLISNETTSLQELDRVIAQNNQILNPRGSGGGSVNLQNNTNSTNSLNTQMIPTAPNVNVYQKQVFQTQTNEMTENQFGGYVIANPQNASMMQQTPGQQQVFVAPYGNQMQLAMNPFQNANNYPQQPGFVSFGMPPQQEYGKKMVLMMNAPNQGSNQPYYMGPIDGNVSQQQQQVPVIMQSPQFLSMNPNSQQANGYPQPQAQHNGGFTVLQPQQIAGYTQPQQITGYTQPQQIAGYTQPQQITGYTQPQQIAGYTQPQQIAGYTQPQQIAGYTQPQEPVMYVLPTGASTVGQNFTGVQGYVYPNTNTQISPVQITNNIQQTSIPVVSPENHLTQSNEGSASGTVRSTTDSIPIINPDSKVIVKPESFDPSNNSKKVIFNSIPKPRLVSDLLNELKSNSSTNINVRWLGLKELAQREKPEYFQN